jgi:FAD/FMN-containing dehydrogenase
MSNVSNWKGDITYKPAVIVKVDSPEQIADIIRNKEYPSPVRAKGSHHSVTRCIDTAGGTLLDLTGMNKILEIDLRAMTITMQPGVLLKDASSTLEQLGLQFYVNVEIGNLTVGSGACCGTKKASYCTDKVREFGQVSSYVESMKIVNAKGEMVEIRAGDPLLEALRSSYGLLGVVYEVTYKIKELQPMDFSHRIYTVDELEQKLDEILEHSTMLYIFPFIERVVVETRKPGHGATARCDSWWFRNLAWKEFVPRAGRTLGRIRCGFIQSALLNVCFGVVAGVLRCLHGKNTSPENQIIRYPEKGGAAAYTFSLWAFDKAAYIGALREYFRFCQTHFEQTGYRCDMPSVGYAVEKDDNALFSYSRAGLAITIDPTSTGGDKWEKFLDAFNNHCSQRGGKPLFNQTPGLKPEHVQRAFSDQIRTFLKLRAKHDPQGRFYTPWFRELFSEPAVKARPSDPPAPPNARVAQ